MSAITMAYFGRLIRASWQAAILVLVVLLIQAAFRRKLDARWRYSLWLLVVARLLLPAAPRSAMSLFNYAGLENLQGKPAVVAASPRPPSVLGMTQDPVIIEAGEPVVAPAISQSRLRENFTAPAPFMALPGGAPARPPGFKGFAFDGYGKVLASLCALVWAIGAGFLALRVVGKNLAFSRRLREAKPLAEPGVLALFEECKGLLGIRFSVGLVETSQVISPALYGFFRPRLLLPGRMLGGFNRAELRYIFLHELAHVKRRDMAALWTVEFLKILHWFNPALWIAFRRMAADRELACDEMALSRAGEKERKSYGAAIIKVLENCARLPALPGVIGILEDRDQMSRRISMILDFRGRPRRRALAILLLLGLGLVSLTDARSPSKRGAMAAQPGPASENAGQRVRPDLVGRVLSKDGSPLAATVFIYTAGPKVGTSTFCPSCYADCGKHVKSDSVGAFKIGSLDPQLIFRVLVVAKGYEPMFVTKVDPSSGPVEVKMKPSSAARAEPERSVRGRVIDVNGDAIEGAVVNFEGVRKQDGGGAWGDIPGFDPLAVTDERGEFVINGRDAFESLDLSVEARAFATKKFLRLAGGASRHDLIMTQGATVTGRVMVEGRPLKNVSVGIAGVNRGMEDSFVHIDIGTGPDGRFAFANLPPNLDYFVYGLMGSLKPYGAISAKKIHAGGDGKTTQVDDLVATPAHRLAGRVVLADGQPVPPQARLLVGRQEAWDTMQIILAEDGSFDTTGIPSEAMSLSVRVPGYAISARNASLDRGNPFQLVGRADRDITGLVFLLAKGRPLESDFGHDIPETSQPRNRPLRGVEAQEDHSDEWEISGRVMDGATMKPVAHFRVIPGNSDRVGQRSQWDDLHGANGTNGEYTVYLDKRWTQPGLQVTAEGYLPKRVWLKASGQPKADFVLIKGRGPGSTVFLPDGNAAPGVTVLLICADDQGMGLGTKGELHSYGNKEREKKTDSAGRFSFAPELGMRWLVAAAPEGFKNVRVETLKTNSAIVLEPYGRIKGRFQNRSGPATNTVLDLAFVDKTTSLMSRFGLAKEAPTDNLGRFEFDHVPPGRLQITYRNYNAGPGRAWFTVPLKQVTVEPDQTVDVNLDTEERPALEFNLEPRVQTKEPVSPGKGKLAAEDLGSQISKDPSMKSITIRAFIDGADTVKIQGGRIWFEHESGELPGKWHHRDEPTTINDKPWLPVWHGNISEPFEALVPAFKPRSPAEIKLTKLSARGPVEISEMPAPENDETLSVRFDDSPLPSFQGADWYEVKIEWKSQGPTDINPSRNPPLRGSEAKDNEQSAAVSRFAQLRRGGTEADQVKEFVAATHEKGVVTRETAFHDTQRRPEFVLSNYSENNPLEKMVPANMQLSPAAFTYSPLSVGRAGVGALLSQCMEATGTRYLIDPEASSAIVDFNFAKTLNGYEFVAAFEGALQTNLPTIYSPMAIGVAVRRTRQENLMLIRESPGIVKVIPRSRLAVYQKAGLIKTSVE